MTKVKSKGRRKTTKSKKLDRWGRQNFDSLAARTLSTISGNFRHIGLISLIFGTLYFIFSNGVTLLDISELRNELEETFSLDSDSVGGKFALAGLVFQTASSLDQAGATYVLFTTFFTALGLLWLLRHAWAKKKTTVKEAFYQGMYPIVPFMLLFILLAIQLIPFIVGSSLYDTAIQRDIIFGIPEHIGGALILLVLPALWTLSMAIRTIMAMIIVTIPDMTPLTAYDSAKKLLKGHKTYAIKQLLAWSVAMLLVVGLLLLLVIAVVPSLAVIVTIIINIAALPLFVTFTYTLYRSLL